MVGSLGTMLDVDISFERNLIILYVLTILDDFRLPETASKDTFEFLQSTDSSGNLYPCSV